MLHGMSIVHTTYHFGSSDLYSKGVVCIPEPRTFLVARASLGNDLIFSYQDFAGKKDIMFSLNLVIKK